MADTGPVLARVGPSIRGAGRRAARAERAAAAAHASQLAAIQQARRLLVVHWHGAGLLHVEQQTDLRGGPWRRSHTYTKRAFDPLPQKGSCHFVPVTIKQARSGTHVGRGGARPRRLHVLQLLEVVVANRSKGEAIAL